MKIIAMEREQRQLTPEETSSLLRSEAEVLWQLCMAGVVRETYFRADRHDAVLVLESPDEKSAAEALSTLPLVRAGCIDFELVPLVPYPGFARLFK